LRKIINTYKNAPGHHCGSVAMRNLLSFYNNLELPEAAVFGLGAGLDLYMIDGKTPMISGRNASLEQDVCKNLGIPYQEQFEPDNAKAWEAVRNEIASERPVMLTGDIFYLDYREFKYHFPAHRFVLVGFDDDKEEAYIMDRIKETSETCSYKALAESRNPAEGFSTFNLYGTFGDSPGEIDLEAAVSLALKMCAERMLGTSKNESLLMQGLRMSRKFEEGIAGIKALASDIQHWSARDDYKEICAFNAENIEKFGNGGGLFRRLYAEFLQWVEKQFPHLVEDFHSELAIASADNWSRMALYFKELADGGDPDKLWQAAITCSYQISKTEDTLFSAILENLDN